LILSPGVPSDSGGFFFAPQRTPYFFCALAHGNSNPLQRGAD